MTDVKKIAGEWVPNEKMHPMTNVQGRDWMTADGEMSGTFHFAGSVPMEAYERGLLWHFPTGSV